jgi:hypothetical protein
MTGAHRRRPRLPETGTGRIVALTLYYLAVILAVLLVRLTPDYAAVPFVYQAF